MERLQLLLSETDPDRLAAAAGAAVLILLVLWWLARRRGGDRPARGAERQDPVIREQEMPESEKIFRLLADHAAIGALPEQFLRDMSSRLRNRENIVEFIGLAEKFQLVDESLLELAGSNADAARIRLATALGDKAGAHPEEADRMMRIAAQMDRENLSVALSLAVDHFEAGRYQEALPLLERAIPICRQSLENAAGSGAEDLRQLLEKSLDMYETCLEQGAG